MTSVTVGHDTGRSQQGTSKQFSATFLTHAKSQINELKNSLKTMNTTQWHQERKENPRSTSTPCLTSKLSKETGLPRRLNKACRSRHFFFTLSPQPSPFLSQPVHGDRKAFLAVTNGLLAGADQPPRHHQVVPAHISHHIPILPAAHP